MANNKELKVTGFIIRDGRKLKRDELTKAEQTRLAIKWNNTAMEAAGYIPVRFNSPPLSAK